MMDMVEFGDGAVRKAKLEMTWTATSNSVESQTLRGIKSGTNYF